MCVREKEVPTTIDSLLEVSLIMADIFLMTFFILAGFDILATSVYERESKKKT